MRGEEADAIGLFVQKRRQGSPGRGDMGPKGSNDFRRCFGIGMNRKTEDGA